MESGDLLRARVLDLARRAQGGRAACTAFLTPEEQRLSRDFCRASHLAEPFFWGGYADAERKLACFLPDYLSEEEFLPLAPIRLLRARGADTLSHRDCLGSLMGLGITRQTVGDLLTEGREAYFFLSKEAASEALRSLEKVGRTPVRLTECAPEEAALPARKEEAIRFTVASLRLDAIISGMFRLSRSEAAEKIRRGLVLLGGLPCEKPDRPVAPGDVISVRGEGKGRIVSCEGFSRKGRIFVEAALFR